MTSQSENGTSYRENSVLPLRGWSARWRHVCPTGVQSDGDASTRGCRFGARSPRGVGKYAGGADGGVRGTGAIG